MINSLKAMSRFLFDMCSNKYGDAILLMYNQEPISTCIVSYIITSYETMYKDIEKECVTLNEQIQDLVTLINNEQNEELDHQLEVVALLQAELVLYLDTTICKLYNLCDQNIKTLTTKQVEVLMQENESKFKSFFVNLKNSMHILMLLLKRLATNSENKKMPNSIKLPHIKFEVENNTYIKISSPNIVKNTEFKLIPSLYKKVNKSRIHKIV